MSEDSPVNEGQCQERTSNMEEQIGKVSTQVSKITGGLILGAFVSSMFVGGIAYHLNYRFSNTDKAIQEIKELVTFVVKPKKIARKE